MNKLKIIRALQFLFIITLPFAIFYWMSPMGEKSVGNDYVIFSIDHQLSLQYAIEKGSFPLYAPGFAGGHSAAALTLGQLYHPISHLAALCPGYWDGTPLEVNNILKLLSIGFAHLVLFILLFRLKLDDVPAFIISFITVYNLRMLDMYRYGASLENYTGLMLLVGAMGLYYIRPTQFWGPLWMVLSTYLLVTGGHPQMMYFGLLGAGLVGLLIPYVFEAVDSTLKTERSRVLRFYRDAGLCLLAGIAIAAVYIIPFYTEFIQENSARVARDYNWSLAYSDSWSGVLNSFFRPLYSNVHGAFGSSAIILLAAIVPLLLVFQKQLPRVIWPLFTATLLVFLISLGKETPVHFVFWKLFPLADTFRTPGRVNLVLPPLFLLLLAYLFSHAKTKPRFSSLPTWLSPMVLFSLSALLIYTIYNVFIITKVPPPTHYHPAKINEHSHEIVVIAYVAGLATLILLPVYFMLKRFRLIAGLLLIATVLIQSGVQLRHGTWIVDKRTKITLKRLDQKMKRKLKVPGLAGFGMESPVVSDQLSRSALDPSLARFYRAYHTEKTNKAAYRYIQKNRVSNEAVVATTRKSKQPTCPYRSPECRKPDTVTLTYSSYNQVAFDVTTTESGVFTLSYPYSPRFTAVLDEKSRPIFRTNGYQLGVFIDTPGKHTLTIRYESGGARAGIVIAFATLFIVISILSWGYPPALRFGIPSISLVCLIALFMIREHRLYNGQNLNTKYNWSSTSFSPADNLAFGKSASMTGIRSKERPYDYYAGRAVDGSRTTKVSSHKKKSKQWWQVDLGSARAVDHLIIYNKQDIRKHLPLLIMLSNDGRNFKTAETIEKLPKTRLLKISLKGQKTRYIRLKSSGTGPFTFKEVEVYGPPS